MADPNPVPRERLLSIPEVAQLCGLSDRSINRAILDGELHAFKLRSRWRVHPIDLEAWMSAASPQPVVPGRRRAPRPTNRQDHPYSLRRLLVEDQEAS